MYLTVVLDVYSRRQLSQKVSLTLGADHAVEIMKEALSNYGAPEIVHTDQGSQFSATSFTDLMLGNGAKLSMDDRRAFRDNVFVERLWRTLKYENAYLRAYETPKQASEDNAEYFACYNNKRVHSSI